MRTGKSEDYKGFQSVTLLRSGAGFLARVSGAMWAMEPSVLTRATGRWGCLGSLGRAACLPTPHQELNRSQQDPVMGNLAAFWDDSLLERAPRTPLARGARTRFFYWGTSSWVVTPCVHSSLGEPLLVALSSGKVFVGSELLPLALRG